MQKEKPEGGKKEGTIIQDVVKKYGLDKYPESEFLKQMEKEYVKVEKKLIKINNYEKMKSEGKPLNEEMNDLIARKDQFLLTINAYKTALGAYKRSMETTESSSNPSKDMSEETKSKTLSSAELKKLSYFFAITEVLKSEVNPNPLSSLPEKKKGELLRAVHKIVDTREDTCLAVMAAEISGMLSELLKNGENSETLNQIMGNNKVTGTMFRFGSAKTYLSSGTEPSAETRPTAPIKKQPKEEGELVHEKSVPVKEASEPKKKEIDWNDASEGEDDKEEEEEEQKVEENEDDGFEVVLSKEAVRQAKGEEEETNKPRGRYRGRRGRGRGREWRGEGEPRGEYRGERRGRRYRK